LNWAIDGWQRLAKRGSFKQPSSSAEAFQDLEDLASPISAFIREKCRLGPYAEVSCDGLFIAWRAWCEGQGRIPTGKSTFGRDLRAVLPSIGVRQHDTNARAGERFYQGICLAE
jgi:putative DNA primase/helicase